MMQAKALKVSCVWHSFLINTKKNNTKYKNHVKAARLTASRKSVMEKSGFGKKSVCQNCQFITQLQVNCLLVNKGATSIAQHQVCVCCFQLLNRLRIYPQVMTLSSKENKLLCGHREGLQPRPQSPLQCL